MNTRKVVAALIEKKTPTDSPKETTESTTPTVNYAQLVRDHAGTVAKYVAIAYAGKVAIDTASKCAVKYTPQR